MKNTIKALSKQFFGAKYESARKSLLAAVILFIAVYAAEFRVEIAPFILYLTSTFFTAGIMWQMLTGRRHMEIMQGMFMLPFDNRSFVFSYVLVLGAHTLITKTLLIWALFFAVASWSAGENHACGLMRLYGVRGDGGGVSDVPERSCCFADPLGRWHFGRNRAGTPVGGGTGRVNDKPCGCGAVSGVCRCL